MRTWGGSWQPRCDHEGRWPRDKANTWEGGTRRNPSSSAGLDVHLKAASESASVHEPIHLHDCPVTWELLCFPFYRPGAWTVRSQGAARDHTPRTPDAVSHRAPAIVSGPGDGRQLRAARGQSQRGRLLSRGHGRRRQAGDRAPVAHRKSSGPRPPGGHRLAGASTSVCTRRGRGTPAPCADGEVTRLHCPDEKRTCPHGSHRRA